MKKSLMVMGFVALIVIMAVSIAVVAAEPMPGVGTADQNPNGCVDCHQKKGDKDNSLSAELKNLSKHPKVSDSMASSLKGCYTCHAKRNDMAQLMHSSHYGSNSAFVKYYGGYCTHCHKLDSKTGNITIKGK